jgi:hypothetical protein
MADSNPLLTTLYVIRSAGEIRPTAEWLCRYYGLSDRTLKRYHWQVDNWESLEATGRLARWIDLEESRSLV